MKDFNLKLGSVFDKAERSCGLLSSSEDNSYKNLLTGIFTLDLIVGGGLKPGRWYDFVGPESSGKTTALYHVLASAFKNIPKDDKGIFIDGEGKVDSVWWKNISGYSIFDTFGKRGDGGAYEKYPHIRYYKPSFGEKALQYLKTALKFLPDKALMGENWYYVFKVSNAKSKTKSGGYTKQQLESMLKGAWDEALFKDTGSYYVKIPNNYNGAEFVIGVDSWPTLIPEAVSEDNSEALGAKARMYAAYVDDIKSLVSSKGGIIIGINQVREKPMSYGNPEDYPCGNALKHACDCRVRFGAISNQNGSGPIEYNLDNSYRHFKIKTVKNKIFIPYKEASLRWWTGHKDSSGKGIDPILDIKVFLTLTGQLVDKRGKIEIKNKKINEVLTVKEFEKKVLAGAYTKMCTSQLESGFAVKKYLEGI